MPLPSTFSASLSNGDDKAIAKLKSTIKRRGGNISAACRDLGISYTALRKKAQRFPHVAKALEGHGLSPQEAAARATAARKKAAKKRREEQSA